MKLAIVGSGIAGLVAAHLLRRSHEVTVFEAGSHIGGHTQTVDIETDRGTHAVDTGFVVYNEKTYPKFVKLLEELRVPTQPTEMSFSVRSERTGLEYRGSSLNTLFAQRSNLLRPSFYRMVRDVLRFNREASELVGNGCRRASLRELFQARRYSREFVEHYVVPMGAAIWSSRPSGVLDFPASFFVRFFENHGLLTTRGHFRWRVIRGGSRRYVEALVAPFRERIRLETPVLSLSRQDGGVELKHSRGPAETFDRVIVATHPDQALRMLSEPTPSELEILGAFEYQNNDAVLHTDASLLPRRRRAWASWNYHIPRESPDRAQVTYNMSRLQGIDTPDPICLTLNRSDDIGEGKILRRLQFEHPVFTHRSGEAQTRHGEIDGAHGIHYCGAYWRNGFHEDGVRSALAVCAALGERMD